MFSKKNRKEIVLLTAFAAAIFIFLSFYAKKTERSNYSFGCFQMDTYISITSDKNIKEDAEKIFYDAEKIYDFHDGSSEVSKLNLIGYINASDKLADSVTDILDLNQKYGNGTDITAGGLTSLWNITGDNPSVPQKSEINKALLSTGFKNIKITGNHISLENNAILDFGSVAKGIALDDIKKLLQQKKSSKAAVSTGSSVLLYGNDLFTVDIISPHKNGILGKVKTNSCFLSTSGGYERYAEIDGKKYCHIIDMNTGYPTETDLTTVTVFCESGLKSDFLSTLIFVGGTKEIQKHLNSDEYKIVAADKNKNLYISSGLNFELEDDSYKQ